MIIDANLLLYAHDELSPRHDRAKDWLEEVLSGDEPVGLPLVTLLAFLRIGTNSSAFPNPLTTEEAISVVTTWLSLPNVRVPEPTELHWSTLEEICRVGQARGPVLMDAHVAALALEHGATLCTSDRDFTRFPRLKVHDPLAA